MQHDHLAMMPDGHALPAWLSEKYRSALLPIFVTKAKCCQTESEINPHAIGIIDDGYSFSSVINRQRQTTSRVTTDRSYIVMTAAIPLTLRPGYAPCLLYRTVLLAASWPGYRPLGMSLAPRTSERLVRDRGFRRK
ncbi:hypothetical protein EAM_1874 [Erwinia amylovora ATCC 49946]|nr:hypothetical protein EAM_1874 [Erwinia amylovora ATCC 49946]